MRKIISQFTIADVFIVCAAVALVAALQAENGFSDRAGPAPVVTEIAAEEADSDAKPPAKLLPDGDDYAPVLFGESSHIAKMTTMTLPAETEQAYRTQFGGLPYYGAFAVGRYGSWGYAYGYAQRHMARAAALARCADGNRGMSCTLYAELLPYAPSGALEGGGETLSYRQGVQLRRVKEDSGPRAFARSKDGSWGVGKGSSAEAASQAALEDCRKMQIRTTSRIRLACQTVAVWQG